MNIEISSQGFDLTPALTEFVETKMRFVLTRYGHRVSNIRVTLTDINGPRGGEDMQCMFKVKLDGLAPTVIKHVDSDMYHAIDVCALRLKRAVSRNMSRLNDHHTQRRHGH